MYGRALAERGLHAVLVRSRGTFGSGGEFVAMRNEREDGLAVLRWLTRQPWADGGIVLAGTSYLGFCEWAVASEAPVQVKAMVPHITSSRLALGLLAPGRIDLDSLMNWSWTMETQERPRATLRAMLGLDTKRVEAAMRSLPLDQGDRVLVDREWPFYQECLYHDQNDPHWGEADFSGTVGDVTVPVSSIAGWYDIFLFDQLRDFKSLVAAGRSPRLTVGPWWHADMRGMATAIAETASWGAALARGAQPEERAPVRLFVMGIDEWRDFTSWPPEGYPPQVWHLLASNALGRSAPDTAAPPTSFTYDPANPTPSVGGALLKPQGAGPQDNRELENRPDVLTFTSDALDADLEVIGEIAAEVWIGTDRPTCDLFVRLCDVDERGKSINVCDNLANVRPAGITKTVVDLSPTAHVFRRGHRIRVQISAGAFPRFARNLGGDGPAQRATKLHKTTVEIFHDAEHPSMIQLPAK